MLELMLKYPTTSSLLVLIGAGVSAKYLMDMYSKDKSGIRLNGLHMNGLHMNGVHKAGLHLNGVHKAGMRMNGVHLNGLAVK